MPLVNLARFTADSVTGSVREIDEKRMEKMAEEMKEGDEQRDEVVASGRLWVHRLL